MLFFIVSAPCWFKRWLWFVQEKRTTEVFIGKLSQFESFGEINILSDVPMSCTITTQTPVELAVVYPQDVKGSQHVMHIIYSASSMYYHLVNEFTRACFLHWRIFEPPTQSTSQINFLKDIHPTDIYNQEGSELNSAMWALVSPTSSLGFSSWVVSRHLTCLGSQSLVYYLCT